jgi:transposase InsO family protein
VLAKHYHPEPGSGGPSWLTFIGFAVQSGSLDGAAVCRMSNEILAGTDILPVHLSSDNDPLFLFRQWQANLRILEVTEVKTVPHVPLSRPFVERLIGTVRCELFDQVLFWTATDLERKLLRFQAYYNQERIHASLDGITPDAKVTTRGRTNAKLDNYRWESHCRGLYQLPAAT